MSMARNQVDTIDVVSLIAFPIFAGIELGVWSLSLELFQFDFAAALVTIGGTGISTALIGALASIIGLVVTGTLSQGNYQDEEWYAVLASILVLPVYAFVPAVAGIIDYSPVIPAIVWLAISGMAVYVSYKA